MTAPLRVDGVLCDETTDWASLVERHLAGPPVWSQRDDATPLSGLFRMWDALREHSPHLLAAVGHAIATAAWDSPRAMSLAARFFNNYGGAPGSSEFRTELIRRWPSIPKDLPDPLPGGTEPMLSHALLRCALWSYGANEAIDTSLREFARHEAESSGAAAIALFSPLAKDDFAWAITNAPQILRMFPEATMEVCLALDIVGGQPAHEVVRWLFQNTEALRHDLVVRYMRLRVPAQYRDTLMAELQRFPAIPQPE